MSSIPVMDKIALVAASIVTIPLANGLEALGGSTSTVAKTVTFVGQFFQIAAFGVLGALYFERNLLLSRLCLAVCITPIVATIAKAISAEDSYAAKIADSIEPAVRIAAKVANIAVILLFFSISPVIALASLALQIYTLSAEPAIQSAGSALFRKRKSVHSSLENSINEIEQEF